MVFNFSASRVFHFFLFFYFRNLLLPLGDSRHFASRRHAQYAFTVHRAEDLSVSGSRHYNVRISFAGMKVFYFYFYFPSFFSLHLAITTRYTGRKFSIDLERKHSDLINFYRLIIPLVVKRID